MSRLPEQRLWDAMRSQAKKQDEFLGKLFRQENNAASGWPDVISVNRCGQHKRISKVTWIELKAFDMPKRGATAPLRGALRPEQSNWFETTAKRYGLNAYVLARDKFDLKLYLFDVDEVLFIDEIPKRHFEQHETSWHWLFTHIL